MNLPLDESEQRVLATLLETRHRDKLRELHHTATLAYKEKLRREIEIIERLSARLAEPHVITG